MILVRLPAYDYLLLKESSELLQMQVWTRENGHREDRDYHFLKERCEPLQTQRSTLQSDHLDEFDYLLHVDYLERSVLAALRLPTWTSREGSV